MPLLLRTAEQDRATRKSAILELFIATMAGQIGCIPAAQVFIAAAGAGIAIVSQPSRR